MTNLTLTVKGSPEVARMAVEAHGFKVTRTRAVLKDSTVLHAEGSLDVAAHWFCEPSECVRGEGFPAGTLLLYR